MTQSQNPRPHGLAGLSVRQRVRILSDAAENVGDPTLRTRDPAVWGARVQLIYDLFSVYGWQGTGGQASIAHNLGARKLEVLRETYELWVTSKQEVVTL